MRKAPPYQGWGFFVRHGYNPRMEQCAKASSGFVWNDLTLTSEHKDPDESDLLPVAQHFVCINLGAPCTIWQERSGQAHLRHQTPGDVLFMPAGQPSRWRWETPAHVLHLLIQPHLVRRVAAESGLAAPDLVNNFGAEDPRLLHLGLALKAEAEAGGGNGALFVESLSTALAAHLLRHYSRSTTRPSLPGHGLSESEIRRVAAYVRENLTSALTLAEIAGVVNVSPFHFVRLWKRATGETPHQFVIGCRVEAAKRLLRRGDLSVGQVAGQVGFAQQSHLAGHFKRATGLSPVAFRRYQSS